MYRDWPKDWTFDELWFDSLQGKVIFLTSKTSRPALGPTQLPI